MSRTRARNNIARWMPVVVSLSLLGGCVPTGPAGLETFVIDLLRNAAAALLL